MILKSTSQYKQLLGNKSYGQGYGILEPCIVPLSKNPYWYSLKFLAIQMGYIAVASPVARHRYGDIGAHCLSQPKSMAGAMCIQVVDSSQEVWYPIRPASTSWNKNFHSSQPKNTFPLSAGVSRPYLPPAANKATETLILSVFPESGRAKGSSDSRCLLSI